MLHIHTLTHRLTHTHTHRLTHTHTGSHTHTHTHTDTFKENITFMFLMKKAARSFRFPQHMSRNGMDKCVGKGEESWLVAWERGGVLVSSMGKGRSLG